GPYNPTHDYVPYGRKQMRYSRERRRDNSRSRSLHRRRFDSAFSYQNRHKAVEGQAGRWQSKEIHARRWQSKEVWRSQENFERRQRDPIVQHHSNGERQIQLRNWIDGKEKAISGCDGGLVDHGGEGFDTLGTKLKRKRNKRGEPFGFAKFSNVRNVSKLLSALNNVYFGHYRVRARIASFNRNDRMEESRPEAGRHGLSKDKDKLAMKEGNIVVSQSLDLNRNGLCKDPKAVQASRGDVNDIEHVKGDTGESEAVRVGDVVVSLGERKELATRHNVKVQEEGFKPTNTALSNAAIKKKDHQVLLRCYRAEPDDVSWAQNGLVATVSNGEAVPVMQRRLTDAGFTDVVLIPMGAEKVFVRSLAGDDAMAVVNNAKEFFQLIFSSWNRWDNFVQPYRRGAWVRLYGIPLQAWNANFFKLCVLDCGRFLRIDSCSADKDRLDYARVLIATTDLEFVNTVATVLVDGLQVEVKIVEERCYALGEDTCLLEDGSDSEMYQSDNDDGQEDPEVRRQIDIMVDKFAKGVEEAGDMGPEENFQLSNKRGVVEGRSEKEALVLPGLVREATLTPSAKGAELSIRSTSRAYDLGYSPISAGRQDSNSCCSPPMADACGCPSVGGGQGVSTPITNRSKRAQSCPPGVKNTTISGPWSLEWLQDRNQGDVGVLFSANKWLCKGNRNGDLQERSGPEDPKRRKGGGVFRHTISSIKKVARMPSPERGEVLKVLKKNERHRKVGPGAPRPGSVSHPVSSTVSSSSVSANNDWQHWVVMKGSEQVVVDDVKEVGKAIGVNYNGGNENMFSVLARRGIAKKTASGQTQGGRRGLLTLWDSSEVEVWSSESFESVLWCHGRVVRSGEEFYVANVYAPCDNGAKQLLWNSLSVKIQALGRSRVCVCGDFNAVRSLDERRSVRVGNRSSDHIPFNRFIDDNTLVDLPL
ncbi:hypothetical protein L195_g022566, partial [Trifolium pratense]